MSAWHKRGWIVVAFRLLSLVALVCVVSIGRSMAIGPVLQTTPAPFTAEYYRSAGERFGVGLSTGIMISEGGTVRAARITDYDVASLRVGWYSDWGINLEPLRPNGVEYAQLVPVHANSYPTATLALTETILANPASLWIVGNEPEGKYGQGNRTPAEYAVIYHDVYTLIKGVDANAQVAIGGVIEPTPLRRKWLEMLLSEYRERYGVSMPVDAWNIHVQILQEKGGTPQDPLPWGAEIPAGLPDRVGMLYTLEDNANPALFRQLVSDFRRWMKEQGFQNKPLIISEYGVLMPSDILAGDVATGDQMVIDFMRETFNFLVSAQDPALGYPADGNRLVQQWLWYSLNGAPFNDETQRGFNGGLFSHLDPTWLTKFGQFFRTYMNVLVGPKVYLPVVVQRAVLMGHAVQE